MTYHHEKVENALVRRATEFLLLHRWPRLWMLIACAATIFAWWSLCGSLGDIPNFALRYGLCAAGSYVAWFAVVGGWCRVQPTIESSTFKTQMSGDGEAWQYAEWRRNRDDFFQQVGEDATNEALRDPLGGFGAILVALVLGGPIVGLWLVSFSPQFLAELLVASGKVKHPSKYAPEAKPWYDAILSRTGWFALALILHYAALAFVVQWFHPDAAGICEALQPPEQPREIWE